MGVTIYFASVILAMSRKSQMYLVWERNNL